jgi:hypothetical protein
MAATISGSVAFAPSGTFVGAAGSAQSANAGNVIALATSARHSFFPRIISSILQGQNLHAGIGRPCRVVRLKNTAPAHKS